MNNFVLEGDIVGLASNQARRIRAGRHRLGEESLGIHQCRIATAAGHCSSFIIDQDVPFVR